LSAKLEPTFEDRGCHVVSVADPYGRILGFLDRSQLPYSDIIILKTSLYSFVDSFITCFLFPAAELKMDVLREREVKENLERQLMEEQKIRGK
jgi:hypothetical protein